MKIVQLSGYSTVINCSFGFRTRNIFAYFYSVRVKFNLICATEEEQTKDWELEFDNTSQGK